MVPSWVGMRMPWWCCCAGIIVSLEGIAKMKGQTSMVLWRDIPCLDTDTSIHDETPLLSTWLPSVWIQSQTGEKTHQIRPPWRHNWRPRCWRGCSREKHLNILAREVILAQRISQGIVRRQQGVLVLRSQFLCTDSIVGVPVFLLLHHIIFRGGDAPVTVTQLVFVDLFSRVLKRKQIRPISTQPQQWKTMAFKSLKFSVSDFAFLDHRTQKLTLPCTVTAMTLRTRGDSI